MSKLDSPRSILLMSAMMPGLGQFLQRRWVSAAIHFILFNYFCILLFVRIVRMMIQNVEAAVDFAAGQPNSAFSTITPSRILIPFALAMAAYLSGLIDTAITTRPRPPPELKP